MVDGDKLEESGLLEMEKQIILSWVTGCLSLHFTPPLFRLYYDPYYDQSF